VTEPILQYHFNVVRQYNSTTRGERVNMGIEVKDINTGRCLRKVRKDSSCMIGISPDMTPEQAEAIMIFFGGDREWQEAPGEFERWTRTDGSFGGSMACNQIEKGGFGIGGKMCGVMENTLEHKLERLFQDMCTPYRYNKEPQ
jgi:hypothetical protein